MTDLATLTDSNIINQSIYTESKINEKQINQL